MRLIHGAVIVSLLTEILYCAFQVFIVLDIPESNGPLLFQATHIPLEVLLARRLYAIEGWIAFSGLALYLALTEIAPRKLLAMR